MRQTLILVSVFFLSAAAAGADPPAVRDFYAMSAEEFFRLPEASRPLEPGGIDHALLDAAVFHATNQVRAEHRRPLLRHDPRLSRAAEVHARAMIEHGFFQHENPHDASLRLPLDRVLSSGYTPRLVAENLVQNFRVRYEAERPYYRYVREGRTIYSYSPDGPPIPPHSCTSLARAMLKEWLNSPSHRDNLLHPNVTELGAAVRFRFRTEDLDEALGVQVFAIPRE